MESPPGSRTGEMGGAVPLLSAGRLDAIIERLEAALRERLE